MLTAATHSGPFHADDVLAFALLQVFYDPEIELIRTREPEQLASATLLFDVGGSYDPDQLCFDHHQQSYTGSFSSAGMILAWLEETGRTSPDLASLLREQLVDYVDAVDNGRLMPSDGVPCFAKLVDAHNQGCESLVSFDAAFQRASTMARQVVEGMRTGHLDRLHARAAVLAAMQAAVDAGSNLIELERYYPWKEIYFDNGGDAHPTEFVLHPGVDGRWRAVAIPPNRGSYAQKRSFPLEWAGLRDEELSAVVGVEDALFCHKNRFIAVFTTREGILTAMRGAELLLEDRGRSDRA